MRKIMKLLILMLTISVASSVPVGAQGVQDFVINKFDAHFELTNADPQGELTIQETIEVDFSGQNRGILRAIPASYKGQKTDLRVNKVQRDGADEPYIIYDEAGNDVLRIGDASVFITGEHTYFISYTVRNVISFYRNHDELYWDVNGDQWLQPFESVRATLKTGARIIAPDAVCYTGSFGSKAKDCTISPNSSGLRAETTKRLAPSQTLTFVQAYEKGYFTEPSWQERNRWLLLSLPVLFVQALVYRAIHRKWRLMGKDYARRGVTVPYFGRPKNVSAMQAAYVLGNNLSTKHISAAIIDLAIRGYIKIVETGSGKKIKHELVLQKPADAGLAPDEAILLNDLFESSAVGASVKLEEKKNKLYSTIGKLAKSLDETTAAKGFYELSPRRATGKLGPLIGLAVVTLTGSIAVSVIIENPLAAITGSLVFAASLVYAGLMTKRSRSGNLLVEHMEGLKLYLGYSEKDRLAAHDAVEAPLAPGSGQPKRDVKFFEKLLPFAVAMGVEKTWAAAFADVYKQPPEWYGGNWSTFNTAVLASSVSSMNSAAAASFSAPSSSGGSGFSGGGGAGGGGGGGGGGGW